MKIKIKITFYVKKKFSFLKYVSSERKDILTTGLIRFTQTKHLNDPFELSPTITHLTSDVFKEDIKVNFELNNDDYQFSIERYNKKNEIESLFDEKTKSKGILSLTTSKTMCQNPAQCFYSSTDPRINLTMWAHYADCHKGFIIEFYHDFIKDLDIKKVEYKKERRIVTFEEVEEEEEFIYFEKSVDWSYENEWRGIFPLKNADKIIDDDIYLFKFDKSKVKSITFGCRMSNEDKKKIFDILNSDKDYKNVDFYFSYLCKEEYKLKFYTKIKLPRGWGNNKPIDEEIKIQKKPILCDK